MEKINYEELIDPLCIPIIKYLRENLGIETLYCCQGRAKNDSTKEHSEHSWRGYICATLTDKSLEIFKKMLDLERSRWKMKEPDRDPRLKIDKDRKRVTFYMPQKVWLSKNALQEEWDLLLKEIKK